MPMCLPLCHQLLFVTNLPTTLRRLGPPCCRTPVAHGAVSAPVLASQSGFYRHPAALKIHDLPSSDALNWMGNRFVPALEVIPLGHHH